jgi:hypothetical protein
MRRIPTLKLKHLLAAEQEKTQLTAKFGRLDIEELEHPWEKFDVGILDVYPRCLTASEAQDLIVTFRGKSWFKKAKQPKYLAQERSFLSAFYTMWKLNGNEPVFIYFPRLATLTKREIKYALKNLNSRERTLLKHMLKSFSANENLLKTRDFRLIALFVKLSTRELLFSNFFFRSAVVIGNFECSFPVYALEERVMERYRTIAHSEGLFIRIN